MKSLIARWIWTLGWLALPLSAGAQQSFTIQTPLDKFELVLSGSRGSVNGKPADLATMKNLLPLLTKAVDQECSPIAGKAQISVKQGDSLRLIYAKQGLVAEGKNCMRVDGDGLYFFPVHRDFLIGAKKDGIVLKSPLRISRQGKKMISVRKNGKDWVNEDKNQLVNWDFLERFENSLADFDIRLRVQEGIAEGRPKVVVQSGDQTYEFYKITGVMWALKKPGTRWLIASDDWSFWYDFDESLVQDRYAEQIRLARDSSQDKETRLSALQKMLNTWSPNQRELYHKILLNPNEDESLQEVALKRLKRKPAIETAGVLIQFLRDSKNDDLKREAGAALRLQNPKGPKFDPGASPEEQAKTLEFWRTWWQQNSNKP